MFVLVCAARFGKYTARWSADKSVRTYVNGAAPHLDAAFRKHKLFRKRSTRVCSDCFDVLTGQEMPFTLHLSRDGDVFFMRNLENGTHPGRAANTVLLCVQVVILLRDVLD